MADKRKDEDEERSLLEAFRRIRDFPGTLAVSVLEKGRDKTIPEMVSDTAALPGAITIGLLEGIRDGGIGKTGAMTAGLLQFVREKGLAMLVPGTGPNKEIGSGVQWMLTHPGEASNRALDFGEGEAERFLEFIEDPIKTAKEDPLSALEYTTAIAAPGAVGLRKSLMRAGMKVETDVFAEAARVVGGELSEKVADMQQTMRKAGIDLSVEEAIDQVVASDPRVQMLRRSSLDPKPLPQPTTMPHGKEARWLHASGERGVMAFGEFNYSKNMENLLRRQVSDNTRAMFKGLNRDARSALHMVAARMDRVPTANPDITELRFGGILRAGLAKGEDAVPGKIMGKNLVVGPELSPGVNQMYRVISPDEAKGLYQRLLREHPEAEEVLEAFLAVKEPPIVTYQGKQLMPFARKPAKEFAKVVGLEQAEADMAAKYFRDAFGPVAFDPSQPWVFNWVPDVPSKSPGLGARFRGSVLSFTQRKRDVLTPRKAVVRRRKTGVTSEESLAAEGQDLLDGLIRSRTELQLEPLREDTARKILKIAAEPLTPDDRRVLQRGENLKGYTVFSASRRGLYPASAKFRGFIQKNKEFFEQAGIDVPNAIEASFLAGGRAHKIHNRIAKDLGHWYEPELLGPSSDLFRKFDKHLGDAISGPLLWNLEPFSAANRNMLSQGFMASQMFLRDFYRGLFQHIPGWKYDELPWQSMISDFTAFGKTFPFARKGLRNELPPEMMSSTYMMEQVRGSMSSIAAIPLRYTGFNHWDVTFRRFVQERTYDAWAKNEWARAKRLAQTGGMSKAEFIRKRRADVPPAIAHVAWREMDTWAGDYSNVPIFIEKAKEYNTLRAMFPYPTYITNLWTKTFHENGWNLVGILHNIKNMGPGKSKAQRVNALANLAAGGTTFGIMFNAVDELGAAVRDLSLEIDDPEIRRRVEAIEKISEREMSETDLRGEHARMRSAGRVRIPFPDYIKEMAELEEDAAMHVRVLDQPMLGDLAAMKSIFGGHMTPAEYFNERVSLGPLAQVMMIMMGFMDHYDTGKTGATRFGEVAGGFVPFHRSLDVIRKLEDPTRRSLRGRDTTFNEFLAGASHKFPMLGRLMHEQHPKLLKPQLGVGSRIKTYKPEETLTSHFFLNVRVWDKAERDAALSALAIQLMTETRREITQDRILRHVQKIADAQGNTPFSEALEEAKMSKEEFLRQTQMDLNAALIIQAFEFGGEDAAINKYIELMKQQADAGVLDDGMVLSAERILEQHIGLERKGLKGFILMKEPERIQTKFSELEGKE